MPSTITSRLEGTTTSVAVKAPCRLKTTANHALTGLAAIDGVTPADGDRILVGSNTDAVENGIYVAHSGAWTRALDFDGSLDAVCGTLLFVRSGDEGTGTFWRVTTPDDIVIGTSEIEFASTSGVSDAAVLAAAAAAEVSATDAADSASDALAAQSATTTLLAAQTGTAALLAAATSIANSLAGPMSIQGRWNFAAGPDRSICRATIRQGSGVRFAATGATSYALRYIVPAGVTVGKEPVFDVYRGVASDGSDSAAIGTQLTLSGTVGVISSVTIDTGRTAGTVYYYELRLRGNYETDARWIAGVGPQVLDVTGGTVSAWPDPRPKALFDGDSITEAAHARGTTYPPIPTEAGGDICYGRIFCDLAGYSPIINGFGGAGVISDVALGDIPPYWAGTTADSPAFYHKQGLIIEPETVEAIFLNLGTNDAGVGSDLAEFKTAYIALVEALQAAHPLATIYIMRPFGGAGGTVAAIGLKVIETAIATGSQYIDTEHWAMTYTDGIHPDVAGHALAGAMLDDFVTNGVAFTNGDFSNPSLAMWPAYTAEGGVSSLTIVAGAGHMTGFSQHQQGFVTVIGATYNIGFTRSGTDPYVQKSDDPGGHLNVVSWAPGTSPVSSSFVATSTYTYIVLTTFTDGVYDDITVVAA